MNWETTFILGGGPSAVEVDTACLMQRGVVLGVNDASFYKPCNAFFSNDHGYALGIREKIESFKGPRHLAIRTKFLERFADWDAIIWRRIDEEKPPLRRGVLSSGPAGTPGCSGYVALNLAAQMGAKRIVLFGYDFTSDYRYFFDPKPYPRVHVHGVLESFKRVAPWYAGKGIEILNANPESAIHAFRKITHEQAYSL